MSNSKKSPIDGFMLMRFKPDTLVSRGLPLVEYPVPIGALDAILGGGGDIDASQLLVWIQEYIAHQDAPWRVNNSNVAMRNGNGRPFLFHAQVQGRART